jgi:dephospho-CoA kinase
VIHDADAEVARLYAPDGAAAAPVLAAFPSARGGDGGVDRQRLSAAIAGRPDALRQLEAIVHPLVSARRHQFLEAERAKGTALVVYEIQLLFETGREAEVDATVVVTAPPEQQRVRAMARPGMTAEKLEQILARQMPDAEKRARADFVIDTGKGLEDARRQVAAVVAKLAGIGERTH